MHFLSLFVVVVVFHFSNYFALLLVVYFCDCLLYICVGVYVAMYLLNLNELDEVQETMKTKGYLYITWVDDQMAWTPANYGNIESSFWPQVGFSLLFASFQVHMT